MSVTRPPGGDELIVAAAGKITILTGGKIVPNSGTQAAAIADIGTVEGALTNPERIKINLLLAALRGVGIIAT